MDLLLDEVLVEVLQYLSVQDLLACRLVCKRLGGLVLDGRVWRHREFLLPKWPRRPCGGGLRPLGLRRPRTAPRELVPLQLLRLVPPRLDHLYVCVGKKTLRALTKTKCAVVSLTLDDMNLHFKSQWYAKLVGHQEALGHLRHVHLNYRQSSINVCDSVLLDALTTLPGLESLTCNDNFLDQTTVTRASSALYPRPSALSLKKFSWHLTEDTALFVHAVLARHSSTLEDVYLRLSYTSRWTDDTVAAVLATLPKLHSLRLTCPNLPGLPAVAECGSLRKLCLEFVDNDSPNVVYLLRRAQQLRDVRLDVNACWEVRCEVMEALASPALERLELRLRVSTEVLLLLRALPTLPALRHLVLVGATSLTTTAALDLLHGITPATAPALRILELQLGEGQCPHAWAHEGAIRTALVVNPSLQIQLSFWDYQLMCKKSPCSVCALGCHTNIGQAIVCIKKILKLSLSLDELEIVIS